MQKALAIVYIFLLNILFLYSLISDGVNIDVGWLVEVLRVNARAVASLDVLLRLGLLLLLRHLVYLILYNHIRVNLLVVSPLAEVFEAELGVPGVSLVASRVCGVDIVRVLALEGREKVVHHDSLRAEVVGHPPLLGSLLLFRHLRLHQPLLRIRLGYIRLEARCNDCAPRLLAGTGRPDALSCLGLGTLGPRE